MLRPRMTLTLCLVLAAPACESSDTTPAPTDGGGGGTAAPLTYTPQGCRYEVSTPARTQGALGDGSVGPNATPDHVHLSFAGPTDSSFVVNWRTGLATTATTLLYGAEEAVVAGAAGPGPGVGEQNGHTIRYASLLDGTAQARVHEVHVCGLSPTTRYFYKVGAPGAYSPVYSVSTGPAIGPSVSYRFAVFGDSRDDMAVFAHIERAVADAGPAFQLHTGDLVGLGVMQALWNGLFEAESTEGTVASALATVPLMVVNGNHDGLAVNYLAQFALPQDQSEGETDPEEWYSFDFASAHFVVLNDTLEDPSLVAGAQRDWLEQDLAAVDRNRTPWVFVTAHRPTYSCSNHGSDSDIRQAWQPIIDAYQVDIVFNGHDHNYERSLPIRGFEANGEDGTIAAHAADGTPIDSSGTVYIVTAASGAPLYGSGTNCYHTHLAESVYHYTIVDIADRTLQLSAYRHDGSLLDSFQISK